MPQKTVIGLISDTHGLLRPHALKLLQGSDRIVHAGDIGNAGILAELARIAPVTVVRGNIDTAPWAADIPERQVLTASEATRVLVLHNLEHLGPDPGAAGIHAVIYGHSHKPDVRCKDGVLYVNPGSAGPRRFSLPITLGRLIVQAGALSAELQEIDPKPR